MHLISNLYIFLFMTPKYRFDNFRTVRWYLSLYKSRISLLYIFYFEKKIVKKSRLPLLCTADDFDIYGENGYPCKHCSNFMKTQYYKQLFLVFEREKNTL